MLKVGIDASNIISGGGLNHLVELLKAADFKANGIKSITIWSNSETLNKIETREKLIKKNHPFLEKGIIHRFIWQKWILQKDINKGYDILFVPGSTYFGSFRPFVTMNRNLLPFDDEARNRYGFSKEYLRLYLLEKIQSSTFQKSDGVIFLTKEALDVTQKKMGAIIHPNRIIPHGISKHFFKKPRPQYPIDSYSESKPFRILYVSTVTVYKHQSEVIEAVYKLREKGMPVVLDLVGPVTTDKGEKLLKEAITQFDPQRHFVFFHGKKSHEELSSFYRDANLFVFASSCETFGQILLEAMASGLPIACSNRSAMPEILQDNGLYFDPEDPQSIFETLESLMDSKELRTSLSNAAFKEAQTFSWDRCAENTFGFIKDINSRFNKT